MLSRRGCSAPGGNNSWVPKGLPAQQCLRAGVCPGTTRRSSCRHHSRGVGRTCGTDGGHHINRRVAKSCDSGRSKSLARRMYAKRLPERGAAPPSCGARVSRCQGGGVLRGVGGLSRQVYPVTRIPSRPREGAIPNRPIPNRRAAGAIPSLRHANGRKPELRSCTCLAT